ncbi:hypothetical protein ElyMa_001261900 [Elysia marginata]|uniref:Uncharacterized protein n=1 Tax=Elysia marginata TaxID=1093978 RepID=A0AAV4ICF8_9GAST|nr:hypothetical protein ElyMa_001261900 [Elysia marginata]
MTTFSSKSGSGGGCRVSTAVGFLLTLLAILVAVGVGLIVHFAETDGKQEVVCKCELSGSGGVVGAGSTGAQTGVSVAGLSEQCAAYVDKGQNIGQICSKCSAQQCTGSGGSSNPATTAAPASTDQKPVKLDIRLPGHLTPVHYDVEIQPFMYSDNPKDFTYKVRR